MLLSVAALVKLALVRVTGVGPAVDPGVVFAKAIDGGVMVNVAGGGATAVMVSVLAPLAAA